MVTNTKMYHARDRIILSGEEVIQTSSIDFVHLVTQVS